MAAHREDQDPRRQLPRIIRPQDMERYEILQKSYIKTALKEMEGMPMRKTMYNAMQSYYSSQRVKRPIERCIMCKVPSHECTECGKRHKQTDFLVKGSRGKVPVKVCEGCKADTNKMNRCRPQKQVIMIVEGRHLLHYQEFLSEEYNTIHYLEAKDTREPVKPSRAVIDREFSKLSKACKTFKCGHYWKAIYESLNSDQLLEQLVLRAAREHGTKKTDTTLVGVSYYYKLKQALDREYWKSKK